MTPEIMIGFGAGITLLGIFTWYFLPKRARQDIEEAVEDVTESLEDRIDQLHLEQRRGELMESLDRDHWKSTIKAHTHIGHLMAYALSFILASVAFGHVRESTGSVLTAAGFSIAILLVPIASSFIAWKGKKAGARWTLRVIGVVILMFVMLINWSILQSAAGEQSQVTIGKKEEMSSSFVDLKARRKFLAKQIAELKVATPETAGGLQAAIDAQLGRSYGGVLISKRTNDCAGREKTGRRGQVTFVKMNRFERKVCDSVRRNREKLKKAQNIVELQKKHDDIRKEILAGRTTASADVQSEEIAKALGIDQERVQKLVPMLLLTGLDITHVLLWIGIALTTQGSIVDDREKKVRKIETELEIIRLEKQKLRKTTETASIAGIEVDHKIDVESFVRDKIIPDSVGKIPILGMGFDAYWQWTKDNGRANGMPRGSFRRAMIAVATEKGMPMINGALDGYRIR